MTELPSIDTHVIVWPEEPTRGFVPCLDSRLKPKRVLILCRSAQVAAIREATGEFRRYGVAVEHHVLPEKLELSVARAKISELLAPRDGEALALNLSGHTTPLSLAAYDLFRERQLPAFTIGTHDDRLCWVHPGGLPGFDLEDRVGIATFLRLNGFEVKEAETALVPSERRELARQLVQGLERFGGDLHTINWLADKAKGSLVSPPLELATSERDSFQELQALFSTAGLLEQAGNRIEFASEDARTFVCGGWLEDHVFSEIRGLSGKGGVQDIARGVKFYTTVKGEPVENELDVVFLADNRLYFIECKTVRIRNNPEGFAMQNSFLYKLHSLKHSVGELNTLAMLISYKPLGQKQGERSEALGLKLCSGRELTEIKPTVQKWITAQETSSNSRV